jgi:nitronate monooxygenase
MTALFASLPLIQAPMAGVQDSALTIAVCQAGGLGSLPCAMLSPSAVVQEVEKIRAQTSAPFNLNFFCHVLPKPDLQVLAHWQSLFQGFYDDWGLTLDTITSGPARLPFDQAMADVVTQLKPPVVSFHFGLPEPGLLQQVKASGAKVISSATTVAEALWLERQGVDAVIAQGLEAGGHRGLFLSADLSTQLGTQALVPQVAAAVSVPVIAAGGIASAEGVKAVLDLGAAAAQVGTTYLLCHEAKTSAVHRQALRSEAAQHTALTNVFTGRPARGIVNRLMEALGPMNDQAPAFPLATAASAPLRARAEAQGLGDFSPLWAGQNARGCQEISAGELTRQLLRGI